MHSLTRLVLIAASLALCAAAQDELPEGKGKETLEGTCTECHGLDQALSQLRTPKQWRAIATEMRWKGASMSDSELNTLVDYLSQNFGEPEPKEQKININKASAGEIQAALDLKAPEAAAIVRYRAAKGPFKEWRDVAKAKGVDKARIEAVKDRITF